MIKQLSWCDIQIELSILRNIEQKSLKFRLIGPEIESIQVNGVLKIFEKNVQNGTKWPQKSPEIAKS